MKISLVIPVYNEEATIGALLTSVTQQSRRPDEVVCVDAGSTDATAARVASFDGRLPLLLVREGRLNPGEARNAGARSARHEWLALTDAGIRLERSWLEELSTAAANSAADVVFGTYEPLCDTRFRRCAALAYVPTRGPNGVRGPSVASLMLRRRVFDDVGGFPPHRAGEDLIFLEKLRSQRAGVAYAPRAVVYWETAPNAAATLRRFAVYSTANLEAGRGRSWHRGVARLYAALGASFLGASVTVGAAWGCLLLPAFFLARAVKAGWQKRSSLPFETMHPAYIVGAAGILGLLDLATLAGVLRWCAREWRRPTP